jgi:hypothetical protein
VMRQRDSEMGREGIVSTRKTGLPIRAPSTLMY